MGARKVRVFTEGAGDLAMEGFGVLGDVLGNSRGRLTDVTKSSDLSAAVEKGWRVG
jgi:hypothetical protein